MTPEHQPPITTPAGSQQAASVLGGIAKERVIIVGLASDIPRALEHPAIGVQRGLEVSGVVTVVDNDEHVRRHAEELHQLIREHDAGIVLVAGPLGHETMRAVTDAAQLHNCRLLAVMPSEVVAGHEPKIVWEGESPLVQLGAFSTPIWQRAVKRAADAFLALTGIVLLSPLFLVIAAIIKLESPGPALFQHWRVGRRGRGFHCLKFRTMREDAEAILEKNPDLKRLYKEHHYKLPEPLDPRVTRFGRLLRRTSLDELPQLINVLMGEMSLVGPRPVVEEELEHYRGSERLLLSVRPGMTGSWAVNGRHHVGYPVRAELELRYVRGWTLKRDLNILAKTLGAVFDAGGDAEG